MGDIFRLPQYDRATAILRGGFVLANRIWIDIEDLFVYRSFGVRLSGIQRLEFELCRALAALPQSRGRVFFVRHDAEQGCLTAVRGKPSKQFSA